MGQLEKLKALTEQCCQNLSLYLIDVKIKGDRNKPLYEIFADTEKGITLGECAELSRAIQDELDFTDDFPEKYRLDVSSPGLETPLREDFQFAKTLGRNISLKIIEENHNIIGKLKSFNKDILSLEDKKGNVAEYSRDKIIEAKVKLQW